ncbi:MAG: thiol-disulfide oxidoreductase DCC family protein [Chitinophagales bacterium]
MVISFAGRPVLFFDGQCNLCNSSVQFIIRHDKKKLFLFVPLQSGPGREALQNVQKQDESVPASAILYYNGKYFVRSAAALYVFKLLGGLWSLLFVGIIVPRFLRDKVYGIISRNRYKWFGKRNECMTPAPDQMDRFLPE